MTTRFLTAAGLAAVLGMPTAAQTPLRLDRTHADLFFAPGTGPGASGGWAAR